ncbi:HD family phosphohydrolase [Clostridium sp. MSJ-11]|uniref:HD family phosphohydrolase n=1 Tax=Clostridium mobile TaxID=2841512 RepID=A0ABS6EGC4_9CLOT|nr:HD family phosphohydrolase [Clostridium mobile]MBU5483520.1 HD family phosphohydrolase [Clostridium mobile]
MNNTLDKNSKNDNTKKNNTKKIVLFICTFIFLYSVLITSLVTQKYSLKEGDIAKVDIKAPREIVDDAATKAKIQQAIQAVPLQYNKNPEVKINVIENINYLFLKIKELKSSTLDDNERIQQLKVYPKFNLMDEDYTLLMSLSEEERDTLNTALVNIMSQLYDTMNIADSGESKNEDVKKAQEFILSRVNASKLPKKVLKDLAASIGYSQIKPNFFYDKEKTEELQNEAKKKAPIVIKKDQTIVKEGEPVTNAQLELLEKLGLLNARENFQWYIYLALGGLILSTLGLQWYYMRKYAKDIYKDLNKMILISILTCISVLLARVLSVVPFLIPLACVPMLFSLLIDSKLSLIINGLNCVLISCAVQFNVEITILAIINAIAGSIILRRMQQRNDIIYSAIILGVINVTFAFSTGFLLSNNTVDVVKKASYTAVGTFISGVLTTGFLPFFESIFDIVTTIKLLELSNPNTPLLKRLLMEAPGTYHHSVLVGNLAELAAEEVGGNPVLARVASYYHDVGKIKRPYFFKENQLGGDNPHNKINPNLSALIITSHIKDGVELAEEYKIPKVIKDVIEQHHGTTLVKYFYITMKNSSENPEEIKEDNFRYPGPKPETKEAAIIMLADSVEAAVRSINDATKGKIEEMVNKIIKDKLNEGQLDNCELTLKDIDKIRESFIKVFMGIYHQRIEYPTDKWHTKG